MMASFTFLLLTAIKSPKSVPASSRVMSSFRSAWSKLKSAAEMWSPMRVCFHVAGCSRSAWSRRRAESILVFTCAHAYVADCALRKMMDFMVDGFAGIQVALHVGRHVWGLGPDGAVICRSGRKCFARKARVFPMLMLIMTTSSIEMRDVVVHLAHVHAAVGVRHSARRRWGPS